ncbi:MAG: alpha/beta hydrolase [Chitinophagaceae bacterium]
MKKKFMKISLGGFIIILLWLIVAQSCMKFKISDSEAKKDFEKEGVALTTKTVKVGKRHMHYAQSGNDTLPTIVFVHGSPGSWNAFTQYMKDKDLLSKYRMISIDRPGFGNSDFGRAEPLKGQSELISPLFNEWKNGKPVYLVGHSLGGPMIIQLYADNPGIVSGLVLLAASVDPAEEKKESWRYIMDGALMQYFMPGAFRPSNRELVYFKKDVNTLQDKFAAVKGKVYIVHGTKDTFVPPGNAGYAIKKLVNAASVETIMIEGANHFIPWQHYDTIKKVLMKLY